MEPPRAVTQPARTSYDVVPYLDRSHTATHPDRLATVARLLAMEPAPVEAARVLELGCAGGGNLIPMADALPGSTFVGVDLSRRQIEQGQAAIAELGLENLTLRHANLADVDESFGAFDYILVHGVFSWVPFEVQERILAICRRNLAEQGVAYVSFNTLPGWYAKLYVRDMMLHAVRHVTDPQARLRKSREMLYQVAGLVAPPEGAERGLSPYAAAIQTEAEIVRQQDDDYIFHEYLEDDNRPMYLHEFVRRAAGHGLQYLGDADRGLTAIDALGPEVAAAIRQLHGDVVEQEQFLDFLTNRTFRCTLLCHAEVALNRSVTADRLKPLFVRASLRAAAEGGPNLASAEMETFENEGRTATVGVSHPVTKAALVALADVWPRALAFPDLLARACAAVYADPGLAENKAVRAREAESLALNLLRIHVHNGEVVSLHSHAPCLPARVPERPLASRSARHEVLLRGNVTNRYHQGIRLNELAWHLLPFLDGTRDHAALADLIAANTAVRLVKDDQEARDPAQRRALAAEGVAEVLEMLRRIAVLVEE
jgi:methyltransferase-like protein/2-polyprenyl-3-methyl-5-hydroxy-6-metoxy-1,4-benzoquinol methylase